MTYRKLFNKFDGKVARDEFGTIYSNKVPVARIDGGLLRVDPFYASGDKIVTRHCNYVAKELCLLRVVGEDIEIPEALSFANC